MNKVCWRYLRHLWEEADGERQSEAEGSEAHQAVHGQDEPPLSLQEGEPVRTRTRRKQGNFKVSVHTCFDQNSSASAVQRRDTTGSALAVLYGRQARGVGLSTQHKSEWRVTTTNRNHVNCPAHLPSPLQFSVVFLSFLFSFDCWVALLHCIISSGYPLCRGLRIGAADCVSWLTNSNSCLTAVNGTEYNFTFSSGKFLKIQFKFVIHLDGNQTRVMHRRSLSCSLLLHVF